MRVFSKNKNDKKPAILNSKKSPTKEEAEQAIRTLLHWVGDDPGREGLLKTPERVIQAYVELFGGYAQSVEDILGTVFEDVSGYDEPVLIRDIPFFSHCEHHMVPIIGKAHVAYQPDGKVIGLSKISRTIEVFARRLQTQEAMTSQIANAFDKYLKPQGVAVLIEAEHLCMAMRGVQKQDSTTVTIALRGIYKEDERAQAYFMMMI